MGDMKQRYFWPCWASKDISVKCGHFKISNHNSNHINSTSVQRPHSIVESTELFIEETSPEQETTSGQPNEEDPEVFDSESFSRQGYINQVG